MNAFFKKSNIRERPSNSRERPTNSVEVENPEIFWKSLIQAGHGVQNMQALRSDT